MAPALQAGTSLLAGTFSFFTIFGEILMNFLVFFTIFDKIFHFCPMRGGHNLAKSGGGLK